MGKKTGSQRNAMVELIRFIMSLVLLAYHFNFYIYGLQSRVLFPGGYRCVEVFFIFSGFFLIKGFEKSTEMRLGSFALSKVRRLYPPYIICYLIAFLFVAVQRELPVIASGVTPLRYVWILVDLVMAQNWGFDLPTLGDWFTSALIISMVILFLVHKKLPAKWFRTVIWAIVLLFSVIIIITHHANLHVHGIRHHISSGVMRALIGLSTGGLAFYHREMFREKAKGLVYAVFAASIILLVALMYIYPESILDYLLLPVGFFLITSAMWVEIRSNVISRICTMGGEISYELYLIHGTFRNILMKVNEIWGRSLLLNIVGSVIMACLIHFAAGLLSDVFSFSRRRTEKS